MNNKKLAFQSFINALGTVAYISLVTLFMNKAEQFIPQEDNFLAPIVFLLLFVVSATITATLVLGKPIQLYLSDLKKEGVTLLLYTIGWLAVFLVALMVIIFVQ